MWCDGQPYIEIKNLFSSHFVFSSRILLLLLRERYNYRDTNRNAPKLPHVWQREYEPESIIRTVLATLRADLVVVASGKSPFDYPFRTRQSHACASNPVFSFRVRDPSWQVLDLITVAGCNNLSPFGSIFLLVNDMKMTECVAVSASLMPQLDVTLSRPP